MCNTFIEEIRLPSPYFLSINVEKPDERFIEEILCRKESNSGKLLPSNVEDNPERSLEIIQETCRD